MANDRNRIPEMMAFIQMGLMKWAKIGRNGETVSTRINCKDATKVQ